MTKMIDALSDESYKKIVEYADTAIELRGETKGRNIDKDSPGRFIVTEGTDKDIAESMMRYVHASMVRASVKAKEPRWDYLYEGHVGEVARELLAKHGNSRQVDQALSSIISQLKKNNLIHPVNRTTWLVREWPDNKTIKVYQPWKKEKNFKHESRVLEETKPVKNSFDLSAIKFPDEVTPDSIVTYVSKLTLAFTKLNTKYDEACRELEELREDNKEMREKLESLANDEWGVAAARIKEMVNAVDWSEG